MVRPDGCRDAISPPLPGLPRGPGRIDLRRHVCARALLRSQAARDHGFGSARPIHQATLSAAAMGVAKKSADQSLIALFLEMLAAERGAAANTLAAYERDLADFSEHLTAARRDLAAATTD